MTCNKEEIIKKLLEEKEFQEKASNTYLLALHDLYLKQINCIENSNTVSLYLQDKIKENFCYYNISIDEINNINTRINYIKKMQ